MCRGEGNGRRGEGYWGMVEGEWVEWEAVDLV